MSSRLKGITVFVSDDVSEAIAGICMTRLDALKQKRREGFIAYFSGTEIVRRRRGGMITTTEASASGGSSTGPTSPCRSACIVHTSASVVERVPEGTSQTPVDQRPTGSNADRGNTTAATGNQPRKGGRRWLPMKLPHSSNLVSIVACSLFLVHKVESCSISSRLLALSELTPMKFISWSMLCMGYSHSQYQSWCE